jgi:hypothetical protein
MDTLKIKDTEVVFHANGAESRREAIKPVHTPALVVYSDGRCRVTWQDFDSEGVAFHFPCIFAAGVDNVGDQEWDSLEAFKCHLISEALSEFKFKHKDCPYYEMNTDVLIASQAHGLVPVQYHYRLHLNRQYIFWLEEKNGAFAHVSYLCYEEGEVHHRFVLGETPALQALTWLLMEISH